MAEPNQIQWNSRVTYWLGRIFTGVGLTAWGSFLYQIFDSVAASLRDRTPGGGSNNLGAGIGLAILAGLVLVASLLAFIGAHTTRNYTRKPEDHRILRFAVILNGALLSCALVGALYLCLFPI